MSILLETALKRQPQQYARAGATGLGRDSLILFNPYHGAVDQVTGRFWTKSGAPDVAMGPFGKSFTFAGGDRFSITGYPELQGHGTLFAFLPEVGAASSFGHIFLGSNSPTVQAFQISNTGGCWMGSNQHGSIDPLTWFNTKNKSIVFVSAPTAAQIRLFIDGKRETGVVGVSSGSSWGAGNKPITLGGYPTGNNWDFRGQMLVLGWSSRLWTESDAKDFHDNPFRVYQAPNRRLWFVPAGGAGPQELAPSAASATTGISTASLTAGSVNLAPAASSADAIASAVSLTPSLVNLAPASASASAVANDPSISSGSGTLSPSAAEAVASAGAPSLSAGIVNLAPDAAFATAVANDAELGSDGSVLTPQAAIATAGIDNPSLSAGEAILTPSAASATAVAVTPDIVSGSQLDYTAPFATASAGTPSLVAGAASFSADAPAAIASATDPALSGGAVQLTPSAAVAVASVDDPDVSSGSFISVPAASATAMGGEAVFMAGLATLIAEGAAAAASASSPTFAPGQVFLTPSASFATAYASDPSLLDGGLQWHSEMLYTLAAEDRSYTIQAEDRSYSVPAV